ncbi:MAG: sigma-70 family RNA polymerase sigma factor [Solobacterium sp.]|nr:sigma-70 family RNA polymerase sigma factor [Solobacterium sp.]
MNDNTKQLIEKAKQGDNIAISELMNQYNSELFNLAKMYSSSDSDAEDALQNTYIRAFRNLSSLEDINKFDSWIKQITVNEAKRIVMSSYNQKNTMFSELDNEEEDLNYDPEDEKIENQPEMAYDKKETSEIVLGILDSLSEDQRIVALMHFYENKTLREIAEELEVPQSTVIGRIQTAKKNIKASVLEMERKDGIKLYNMAPLPFFIYLLHLAQGMPVPTSIHGLPRIGGNEPLDILTPKGGPTETLTPKGGPSDVLNPTSDVLTPKGSPDVLTPKGGPEGFPSSTNPSIPSGTEVPHVEPEFSNPSIPTEVEVPNVEPVQPHIPESNIPSEIEMPQMKPNVSQPGTPISEPVYNPTLNVDPTIHNPIGETITDIVKTPINPITTGKGASLLTKILAPVLSAFLVGAGGYVGYKTFYRPTIDLNEYVSVSIEGYDTIGKAEITYSENELRRALTDALPQNDAYKKIEDEVANYYDQANLSRKEFLTLFTEELLQSTSIDKTSNLSNGDVINLKWVLSDTLTDLEEVLKIKIKAEDITITVDNLKVLDTFNPFDAITVEFEGMNGSGEISIKNENTIGLNLIADKYNELSNGDVVTIRVDENTIESVAQNTGSIPSPLSQEYTVHGLLKYVHSVEDLSDEAYQMIVNKTQEAVNNEFENSPWGYQSYVVTLDSLYVLGDKNNRGNYVSCIYHVDVDFHGPANYTNMVFNQEYEGKISTWIMAEYSNLKVDENNNLVEELKAPSVEPYHTYGAEVNLVENALGADKVTKHFIIGHETKEALLDKHVNNNADTHDISSR